MTGTVYHIRQKTASDSPVLGALDDITLLVGHPALYEPADVVDSIDIQAW